MHDEGPDHPHHFLHRHVRVVKERSRLVKGKLIHETAAWRNRILAASRRPIHLYRNLKSMPVHRRGFWKMVVHDDPDPIPLDHLNRRTGSAAVVPPEIYDLTGNQLLLYRFGDEMELLRAIDYAIRELWHVRSFNGNDPSTLRTSMARMCHLHVFPVRLSW